MSGGSVSCRVRGIMYMMRGLCLGKEPKRAGFKRMRKRVVLVCIERWWKTRKECDYKTV